MKKRAALLVALSLAVVTVLAGCGGKDSSCLLYTSPSPRD